ncbi:hypothetical protein C2S51_002664 [Perilla frutescens var. frutescens]|nr:hypothetical protein C2S51_002664 [Perilla frutescens var. frutescens]
MAELKKKVAVAALCSLLLIAMVAALLYSKEDAPKPEDRKTDGVTASVTQKAITNLCSNTDYQQTCVKTLESSGTNTSDPKQLIQIAFKAAIDAINKAAEDSTVLDLLEKDPKGKSALLSCRELAGRATHDLERSINKLRRFDLSDLDSFLSDMQIWLSGSVTYQETCLDGFEGVRGDSGARMKQFLTVSMEMTSNALAMVTALSSIVTSVITGQINNVNGGGHVVNNRRLLLFDDDNYAKRRLIDVSSYSAGNIKADVVVAKDGSGDFTTIMGAVSNKTFTVYIKEGVYEEKVQINSSLKYLVMVGDGPTKTKITGKLNFIDGTNTYQTATVAVQADHFTAVNIGFENSAGAEKHQAVALRVSGDMAVFYNCQMDGYQDTLYAHTYRQFYRDCVISGTIDFIFGDSAATFQNCKLVVRKPMENQQCIVTAQGRKDIRQPTAIVLQNCSFVADPAYFPMRQKLKSFLGRPWKEYSRTVIMESYIDDLISPEGWLPWDKDFALKTLMYTEFNNRGPGSSKSQRLKWEGVKELPEKRVKRFTIDKFVKGKKWISPTAVPFDGGFMLEVPEEDPGVSYSPVSPSETKDLGRIADKSLMAPPSNSSTSSDSKDKAKEEKEREKEEKEREKEKEKEEREREKEEKEREKKEKKGGGSSASQSSDASHAASPAGDARSRAPAPVSQIAAAPSEAPGFSPVAPPEGGIAFSPVNKFLLTGW